MNAISTFSSYSVFSSVLTQCINIIKQSIGMGKVLFLIIAGKEDPERANIGLVNASRSAEAKRYDDLKVIFFGPSEEYITELNGPPLEAFTKLYNLGAIDSACVFIAERSGKKEKLESMGISLKPAGERISHYVNSGYTVLSF